MWLIGGRSVYAEQAVVVGAVQQLVQLVERPAGRVPRQEGRLLRQVANQLQGDALWEVAGPGGGGREAGRRSVAVSPFHQTLQKFY